MFPRLAGPRRLAGMVFLVFLTWTLVLWIFLPYDHPFILFLQFTTSKVLGIFRSPTADERLLLENPGRFPFTDEEVAYIIKTGYGTQERVPALLEASRSIGTATKYEEDNILIVGDFATEFDFKGNKFAIHDMVAAVMEHEAVKTTETKNTERMQKYENMTLAIQEGRKEEAEQFSKIVGWELDALKVMMLQISNAVGRTEILHSSFQAFNLRGSRCRARNGTLCKTTTRSLSDRPSTDSSRTSTRHKASISVTLLATTREDLPMEGQASSCLSRL